MTNQKVNLFSLIAIQGANALLPLVIFPYLLITLGSDSFADLVIAETLSIVVLAFVLYGFDIVSVKKLTLLEDINKQSKIFFNVFYARLLIFAIAIPLGIITYLVYGYNVFLLFLCWLLVPLSHIFQNAYFYLFKENNIMLAVSVVVSRIAALLLLFLCVKKPEQVLWVPIIIGSCSLLGALFAFSYSYKNFNLRYYKWRNVEVLATVKEAFACFISNVSVLLYRDLNVLILSLVVKDSNAIAIYSLAEKIVKCAQAIFRPISQFFLPKAIKALKNHFQANKSSFKIIWNYTNKQLCLFVVFIILGGAVFYVFNSVLKSLIASQLYETIIFALPMLLTILFGISNYMFGMIGLNTLGEEKHLAFIILIVGIVNILACLFLSYQYQEYGTAASFVLAEMFLFILIVHKYRLLDKVRSNVY